MRSDDLGKRLEIPAGMRSKLEDFQRSVRRVKLIEGILAAVFGLLLSYIVVFGLDRVMETPAWLRAGILLTGSVGLGVFFPLKCHRWIWGTRSMEQVARLLRFTFPRTSDQLLGIVELARSESEQTRSRTLVAAAMAQVDDSIKDRDFSNAVPQPRHRRWSLAVVVPTVVLAGVLIAGAAYGLSTGKAGSNAFVRWLMPWKQTERFTFAQVEPLPEKVVVPYAEPFAMKDFGADVKLAGDTEWSPSSGTVRYNDQGKVRSSRTQDGQYAFELPPQKEAGSLKVSVGDVRETIKVQPMERPELTGLKAKITLPGYLKYSRELVQDVRGGVISLVHGSQASFEATTPRELTSATANDQPVNTRGNTFLTQTPVIEHSLVRNLAWTDEHGLTPRDPFVLRINAVEDEAPIIGCERQEQKQVVLETDLIKFDLNITDDFGIKEVGLEWEGVEDSLRNPNPAKGGRVVAAGNPEERNVSTVATLSARTEGLKPQTLRVRAYAEDFYPDRGRVYSPAYTLHILSPEEHFAWMTDQMGRWLRQAEGVYEHELQLHDTNRELRRMTPEELDTPNTRRKIAQQAAAERANAARLDALTGIGKQLVEEAARNEQFQVGHLETWAEMLQKLEDIADKRMPSVSDLLDNAAQAQGQAKKGSEAPSEKTPPQAGQNRNPESGKAGESEDKKVPPAVPSVNDTESGMNKKDENQADQPPKPPSAGKFGLPATTLVGGPPQEPQECPPAQEELDQAVEDQADLLAEFEKVRDALNKVMGELENSTFVKRLKAASRRQLEVATDLNRTLHKGFGVSEDKLEDRVKDRSSKIADREVAQSQSVYLIQEDLEAYYNRKQESQFREILDDMNDTRVVSKLRGLGDRVKENLNGESIARAEYWADTLDRWAEELVQPSPGGT